MQDAIRQGKILSFSLMNRKESLQVKEEEGRKRLGGEVGGRWCLTFFQRYYKLSECSCYCCYHYHFCQCLCFILYPFLLSLLSSFSYLFSSLSLSQIQFIIVIFSITQFFSLLNCVHLGPKFVHLFYIHNYCNQQ